MAPDRRRRDAHGSRELDGVLAADQSTEHLPLAGGQKRGKPSTIVAATVPLAFAAMVILSLMGIVLFALGALVERVAFPWHAAE